MPSDGMEPAAAEGAITAKIVPLRVGAPACHINEPLRFDVVYLPRQGVSER